MPTAQPRALPQDRAHPPQHPPPAPATRAHHQPAAPVANTVDRHRRGATDSRVPVSVEPGRCPSVGRGGSGEVCRG
ncbi:hypothetical protein, partial [Streptomyces sp. SID12501]|uniref:hypothetical protein n=1 Tax=Streptomyces sp. SID12501 TaxID=2706042 RepID=UPI001944E513